MAVYTTISGDDFTDILSDYDIGELVSAKGIAEGVENSNYLLMTTEAPFIATVYEKRANPDDLPFFMALMEHLSGQGIPCPSPMYDTSGECIRTVHDKPFAIVEFLVGSSPARIQPGQCAALGEMLAKMHLASEGAGLARANDFGAKALAAYYHDFSGKIEGDYAEARTRVEATLGMIEAEWPEGLPSGVIHADLFPDNVLFQGNEITGLIDFYFACTDLYAYDLAICLNAWCFEGRGEFNITKARQLLRSYDAVRELGDDEWQALPKLAQAAAARFLLTRLHDVIHPDEGAMVTPKDPAEYLEILKFHQQVKRYTEYGV